jgi:hypothetical protein
VVSLLGNAGGTLGFYGIYSISEEDTVRHRVREALEL